MKRVLITTGLCVGLTCLAGIAAAATKCVALNSSTTCTGISDKNILDWSSNCTTNGTSITVRGIAGCSDKNGGGADATTDTLTTSETEANNRYCWCKMTSPAVSSWVFATAPVSAGVCASGCANGCSFVLSMAASSANAAAFRNAIFSGLGD